MSSKSDMYDKYGDIIPDGYNSPIELIAGNLQTQIENDAVKVVQSYGFNVDKAELEKALKYDRDQYDKGYAAGSRNAPRWIPVSERLPKESINPHTYDFAEVLATNVWGDVRTYKYGRSHFWHGPQIMDEYVVAWMPLPAPYDVLGQENNENEEL